MEVDEANFNAIMRVNAWGVLLCTQEAARQMMAQGQGGKIVNTASIAGRQGYAEFAPYCASKASVISLTQAAAREFAKHKITVNAFAPGVVVTPLWDGLEQDMIDKGVIKQKGEFIESFSSSILLGFPSKPERYRRRRRVSGLRRIPTILPGRSSWPTAAWCLFDAVAQVAIGLESSAKDFACVSGRRNFPDCLQRPFDSPRPRLRKYSF